MASNLAGMALNYGKKVGENNANYLKTNAKNIVKTSANAAKNTINRGVGNLSGRINRTNNRNKIRTN